LRPINPLEQADWDTKLTADPQFSFFHGAAWLRVLTATYGYTPLFLEHEKAVWPLMEVDSWLTGKRGVSLPFTDNVGPLGADKKTFAEMFSAALELGKTRGWKYLEGRGGKNLLPTATASISFYGHSVALHADEAKMFDAMDGSMRRAIRKAEKANVTVEISQSAAAMRDFFYLQCLTRKRHGLPPQSLGFFLNIQKYIVSDNLGFVAVASHGGRKIAASVYFFLGGKAIYKYGASDFALQDLRGTNLVMWAAMRRLARDGVKSLHLGKTSLAHEGLRRFKLNLGAAEETLDYFRYDFRRCEFVTDKDSVAGWHNRVFGAMPLAAGRLAGRLLYKHWA
jgi:Acetyltransferase (GNAT) domain